MFKIISIVGARPQFVKSAVVTKAIADSNKKAGREKIREILVHTGQHYDYNMNDIFFRQLSLKRPDYNLGVGSASHGRQTARMIEGIEKILLKERPGLVLVYGDTNSTLAGALAAKKLNILLAHVEAGLRSYNRSMPEEVNRVVVDRISDILFCPSKRARQNLLNEGIYCLGKNDYPKVSIVGDVMYDALLFYCGIARRKSAILARLSLQKGGYYLATVHRAANTDNMDNLRQIISALGDIADSDSPVVFSVHPRTKKAISSIKIGNLSSRLIMIDPVSYLDMMVLEANAKVILTDSGGVQKEAVFLKVPCVTLRDETEWVETVSSGYNILAGAKKERIKKALSKAKNLKVRPFNVYGNGKAGLKIAGMIRGLAKN
ncbi:MAG: UDP-N-acetylglucosamine 2-epimerase (non-hydrolyzing) [Candidatus Omnitrophica bacterium CG11_big_fil_rev_8_21_14_0_20_42_13]|uniref:UDP-N-acetylglucosamine 2-epimerase (Non-hydrolyzing) n=1 Tax=Candidatus Ghiorseimicrobium undicola TaxID=1974746 RepID=A0A2H0LYV6_9BACT|nr:MAG: UDP-N-acetylglucosamine 2-epimerase (non-hydrolyzing) [Candidatus Omnitrophica bacterium CG11_big_fil_rev_8_21_14_0_20_42_13]